MLAGEVVPPGLGGSDVGVIRLHADGSLDTSFGGRAFSTLGDTVSYTEGAAPVVLDNSVQVVDAELAALNNGLGDYSGAVLNVALEGGLATTTFFSSTPPVPVSPWWAVSTPKVFCKASVRPLPPLTAEPPS